MKYRMTVVTHIVYTTEIEADSKSEAFEIFDEKASEHYGFDEFMEFRDENIDTYIDVVEER